MVLVLDDQQLLTTHVLCPALSRLGMCAPQQSVPTTATSLAPNSTDTPTFLQTLEPKLELKFSGQAVGHVKQPAMLEIERHVEKGLLNNWGSQDHSDHVFYNVFVVFFRGVI